MMTDTRDMVLVHRVFRREFGLLPLMVRGVADGDVRAAAQVARHAREMTDALHHHHHNEDELLWPRLLQRAPVDAALGARMETQHEAIGKTLHRIGTILPVWPRTARCSDASTLADAFTELAARLNEHLDEEEQQVLPIVARTITPPEWDELAERGFAAMPKRRALVFLGHILSSASPAEQTRFLHRVPPKVRLAYRLIGHRAFTRETAALRAGLPAPSPATREAAPSTATRDASPPSPPPPPPPAGPPPPPPLPSRSYPWLPCTSSTPSPTSPPGARPSPASPTPANRAASAAPASSSRSTTRPTSSSTWTSIPSRRRKSSSPSSRKTSGPPARTPPPCPARLRPGSSSPPRPDNRRPRVITAGPESSSPHPPGSAAPSPDPASGQVRATGRGRPEPRDPGRPRMGREPLDQLRRGVLAYARLRPGEQRPLVDPPAPPGPVHHVPVRGRLRRPPLPVHLVPVLLLRLPPPPPRPSPPRRPPARGPAPRLIPPGRPGRIRC